MHTKIASYDLSGCDSVAAFTGNISSGSLFAKSSVFLNSIFRCAGLFSSSKQKEKTENCLSGFTQQHKHNARKAVEALSRYRQMYGDFTEQHILRHPILDQVMQRYQFKDVEELNEWLENLG